MTKRSTFGSKLRSLAPASCSRWLPLTALLLLPLLAASVFAHGVAEGDKLFIEQNSGMQLIAFIYLGAKHMVTGYDHLLFLFGVIFYLYKMREVGVYVTLFAIGHSVTLLYGVISGTHVNSYIVDAIIGVSVVYKALDNLDAFKRVYNLIRAAMAQAAACAKLFPRQLSFCGAKRMINSFVDLLRGRAARGLTRMFAYLRGAIAELHLPHRPNRVEPRAVKRRPKPHRLLTEPRDVARAKLQRAHPCYA